MQSTPDKALGLIFLLLEVALWLTVIAFAAIGYFAWRRTYG